MVEGYLPVAIFAIHLREYFGISEVREDILDNGNGVVASLERFVERARV